MKIKRNLTHILTIISFFYVFPCSVFAETTSEGSPINDRKRIHTYVSTFMFSKPRFNMLYGITNNLYLGISLRNGEKSNTSENLNQSSNNSVDYFQNNKTRFNDLFTFKTQYFFFGNFYSNLELGLLTGYKEENRKFKIFLNNSEVLPYSKTTTSSDRFLFSLGLGYRKEFFDHILLGTEINYGILSASKINNHYTFIPQYYNGLPSDYIFDQLYSDKSDYGTRKFFNISIYAGIAI
ncbi:hypothetical protein [Leptospira soteropolitanensis]|nr:hypothetical protein [Leptospira soteropolitanensis]MCW7502355.1 hypothetical protein [Leptospira soteropolitanensis]MCW7532321.1 hypothetical protein [Leptospira soteropolitanensis]